jgi:hypothetical protein
MSGPVHPYASAAYAAAFAPMRAIALRHAATHVLERAIPGSDARDAMGCYPICVFDPVTSIDEDFVELARCGLVSLVLVTDCLGQADRAFLEAHFDHVRPYKTHFVHDARQDGAYTKHHRDRVRRARRVCETRVIELADHLDGWWACYQTLVAKHAIGGIQNFPRSYFEALSRVPGIITIGAFAGGELVSAHIWLRADDKLYAHLAASTAAGYRLRSAFAIYDHAIQQFRGECVIDFGGGAGVEASESDGLAAFKRGFANRTLENFLCGRILDRAAYDRLCAARAGGDTFFPAYRG